MNGQAKIDFEKWFFEYYNKDKTSVAMFNHEAMFNHFQEIVKQAYIIYWFNSVGVTVDTIPRIIDNKVFFEPNTFCLNPEIITEDFEKCKTRQEATEKAIEKAVEIYNNLK